MDENIEQSIEVIEQPIEVSEQSSEVSDVPLVSISSESSEEVSAEQSEEVYNEESEEVSAEQSEEVYNEESEEVSSEESEEELEEEKPKSTVIQVVENSNSPNGYDLTELDVESLNTMSEAYIDNMLAVTPTSNDYYDFIGEDVSEYFSGVMANYPFNTYRAYHLRHWVNSSQYYSYYDDYYYLFYNYPANDCIELKKYHDSSQYIQTVGTAEILDSTITYGSDVGLSDLREGVSYAESFTAFCILGGVLVLYIVNAIFRHLHS